MGETDGNSGLAVGAGVQIDSAVMPLDDPQGQGEIQAGTEFCDLVFSGFKECLGISRDRDHRCKTNDKFTGLGLVSDFECARVIEPVLGVQQVDQEMPEQKR